jgi:N-acetylglucosamine kinase-like BadF-type ATPase
VAAAFRSRDRDGDKDEGRSRQLFESILNFWQLETEEQLVLAANRTPSPDFAALFPSVLAAAESGDGLAVGVLTQAGAELAGLAQIVSQRIFREDETIPVAMSGGVFASSALVRQVFYNRLQASHPQVAVSEAVAEPVRGALELARRGEAR